MSGTIDERVVGMRFDNQQFEQGVKTTMGTLDRFKQSLKLDGATKGLEDVDRAVKGVNMSGLSGAVETVKNRFSALEVVAITALANLTNSVVNAGKRLVNSLTLEPVMQGFSEYELKMGAVQTIMASTGADIKVVNGYLDELNTYADRTIYSFSDMTQSIGKFTNAGVSLDDAVKAIQGISNEAAVSGANANEASRAMYNFAQALSAGSVKLIDWKSIENANMATVEFKQSLLDTALAMGTVVKVGEQYMTTTVDANGKVSDLFTATSMFNDSLSAQWMTTEVLVQTLGNYATDVREMTAEERESYREKLRSIGYTEEQIKAIEKLGQKAFDSAQDVKTFTQLMDTLKEAAGSGWAQTFEILFGDLEEAKALWTAVSKVVGGFIDKASQARNDMLQGWKDLGGRKDLIDSIQNAFDGMLSIAKPVSQAFRDIFPPTTSAQLTNLTKGLKEFTSHLKLGDKDAKNLRNTFKGLFAVLDITKQTVGATMKVLFPMTKGLGVLGSGVLAVTGKIGEWLTLLDKAIKKNEVFHKAVQKLHDILGMSFNVPNASEFIGVLDKLKARVEPLQVVGKAAKAALGKLVEGFQAAVPVLAKLGGIVVDTLGKVCDGIAKALHGEGFDSLLDLLNGGMLLGIGVGISKFIKNLTGLESVAGDTLKSVIDGAKETLADFQASLKADTLMKIASAVAVLAGSLLVLSLIDSDKLGGALASVSVLFGELAASMAVLDKTLSGKKSLTQSGVAMIEMSAAILILALALKKVAGIDSDKLAGSLMGISVLIGEMVAVSLALSKWGGKIQTSAVGMILFAEAINVLAKAVGKLAELDTGKLTHGLVGIGVLMGELAAFMAMAKFGKFKATQGLAILELAMALQILVKAVAGFGKMDIGAIKQGLLGVGAILAEVALAVNFMPKNMLGIGLGLIEVAAALKIISGTIKDTGGMEWEEIGKGLLVLASSLTILAIALNAMKGTLGAASAMLVMSVALAAFTPVLKSLGSMCPADIGKALLALAGTFTVLGLAAAALGPMVPVILGLSGALALLGVAVGACGVGLLALSAGLATLAVSGVAGVTAFIAVLEILLVGVLNAIANSGEAIANAVKSIVLAVVDVVVGCAPAIAEGVLTLVEEVLKSLSAHAPNIVAYLMDFLVGVINAVADRLPELLQAAVKLIGTFFQGITNALKGLDTTTLLEVIAGMGLLSALMIALASVTSLVPAAMVGVVGLGAVVAELALVLAAIGAFAQLPGLEWLIGEGGNLLQGIGTAIGKFVGGIAGGFMNGVSSQFPQIGKDLSAFMNNLQPFIEGAGKMDAKATNGVKALAETILMLTAANILDGLTKWFAGGSSITKFGEELIQFGLNLKKYADSIQGMDAGVVTNSANAAKALSELANNLPNTGGLASWFTGDNDIGKFGESLQKFGTAFLAYYQSIANINVSQLSSVVTELKKLVDLANGKIDASSMSGFAKSLADMGDSGINGFIQTFTNATAKVTEAGSRMLAAFMDGVKSKQSTLVKTFDMMAATMLTAVRSKQQSFYATGSYLVDGFVKGISDNAFKAAAQAKAMATSAMQAAQEELGVHSPSKVFAKIGGYVVDGFANGINAGKGKAAKSAKELAKVGVDVAKEVAKSLKQSDSVFSDFVEKTDKNGKAVKVTLKQAAEAFKSFRNSVKESIEGAMGVFDAFEIETDVTGKQLLENLKSQISGITEWAENIQLLAARGIDKGLLKVISDMGPSGAKYASVLVAMSDKELKNLNKLYKQRMSLNGKAADEIAASFLDGGKKAVKAYEKGVTKAAKNVQSLGKLEGKLGTEELLKGSISAVNEIGNELKKAVGWTYKDAVKEMKASLDYGKGAFQQFVNEYLSATKNINVGNKAIEAASKAITAYGKKLYEESEYYKEDTANLKAHQKELKALQKENENLQKQLKKAQKSNTAASKARTKTLKKELEANEKLIAAYKEQIKEDEKEIAEHTKKVFNDLRSTLSESVAAFLNPLKASLESGIDLFKKFESNADLYEADKKNLDQHKKSLEELEETQRSIQNEISKYADKNTLLARKRVKELNKQLAEVESSIEEAKRNIEQAENDMAAHSGVTVDSILENMQSQVAGVKKWQENLQALAGRGLSQGLLAKLKDMGTDGVDYVDQFMKMTSEELQKANELFAQSENLTSQTLINNFKDSLNTAKSWADGLQKMAQMGFGQELLEKLGDMGVEGYDYVRAFLSMTSAQVAQFNREFADSLKLPDTVADKVISSYAYAGGQSVAGFTAALAKLSESGSEENTALVATTTEIGKVVGETLRSKSKTAGKDAVNALAKGITSKSNIAADSSASVGNTTLKAMKGVLSEKAGKKVATDIVSGLSNGLLSGTAKIASVATHVAQTAYSSAKIALGIKSPSKKFAELGEYTDAGFVEGLLSGEKGIYRTAVDVMSRAIQEVSDAINSDMDVQPTIRPVMDLTDIQNGASSIGKIMDGYALAGSVSLAGITAKDMNRYGTQTDDSALGAIRKLQDTLTSLLDRPSIEQHNAFSIAGNDPMEIANKVSHILQQQVERKDATWA